MAFTILFILYCIEAGLFFVVVPWSRFWGLNPLLHTTPLLGMMVDSVWTRGLVSGFGLVHLVVGIREIVKVIGRLSKDARDLD